MEFKVPRTIPQDLLLIQEFVNVPQPLPINKEEPEVLSSLQDTGNDHDIESSDNEDEDDIASEEEIATNLTKGASTDDELPKDVKAVSVPSESSSEAATNSESDSDSLDEEGGEPDCATRVQQDLDDDEDPVPAVTSGSYFQTKHEVPEVDVAIPDVDEVGADEVLEKVGEVLNIIDHVAIVRGLASPIANRGSDRALDTDTLLVFDDRKVMGYIYETFGPTTQPLYQVKFNSAFPLDHERVKMGREVFHVPTRSHFVFVSQIKAIKGSDASNVHDEEPADDELEFSDDEAEAAHRSRLKRKRGDSRARSVASSRASTPNPTLMRDQELVDETFFSRNAYDEHGPYDIDYTAGPSSRPPPMPYDDPYGDVYTAPDVAEEGGALSAVASSSHQPSFHRGHRQNDSRPYDRTESSGRGQGRGRGRDRDRDRGGHRDRGRGNGARGRGRGSQRYGSERPYEGSADAYNSRETRSMSPTSLAIARATGQGGHPQASQQQYQFSPKYPETTPGSWGYGQPSMHDHSFQQQQFGFMQQDYQSYGQSFMQGMPFVQPHINPRFASAFGISFPPQQQQGYSPSPASATHPSQANLNSEWTVPSDSEQRSSFSPTEESKNSTQ